MVFFIVIPILIEQSISKQWNPDQTSRFAASDLGLHCLPIYHKKDASHNIWVKRKTPYFCRNNELFYT